MEDGIGGWNCNRGLIADYACETGENPLWHPLEKRIYWCDIPNGRLFRYDPLSGVHEQCYEGRTVGGFTIQSDGSLLLFMDRGAIGIWRGGEVEEIIPEIEGEAASRFNDVIADPHGRVFCETMSSTVSQGRLYRLDTDGSLTVLLEGIGCSNGMAFTLDQKTLYYTDSFAHEIYRFDYNVEDGSIGNRRVFARFDPSDGSPDGVTLDAEGYLWTALWDGGCIVQLNGAGKVKEKISFPARKVSSLTFGGAEYSEMYVTTAGGNTKQQDGVLAGALFRLKARGRGVPDFLSRIRASSRASSTSTEHAER